MKFAFCIGNGESRKGFNINSLRKYGTIYGANALFRDLKKPVDHLVCCDRTMAMEAVAAKYDGRVYTRKDWIFTFPYENYNVLPNVPWEESEKYKESFHMGSGLHAVNLAVHNDEDILVCIGHDFWNYNDKHNNLYKGSVNYPVPKLLVSPHFWIQQFELFFKLYPKKQFVFAQPNAKRWPKPKGWNKYTNVNVENLGSLLNALDKS